MRTLLTHGAALQLRLAALTPQDQARWGVMSVEQMLAHLVDACRIPLGERDVLPAAGPLPPKLLKLLALRAPVRWGKSFPTVPELDQRGAGTPPTTFAQDRATLLTQLARLAGGLPQPPPPHPFFGPMTLKDWHLWAYRHIDHHLRQFGR